MEYGYIAGDTRHSLEVQGSRDKGFSVTYGDATFQVRPEETDGNRLVLEIDGRRRILYIVQDKDRIFCFMDGRQFFLTRSDGGESRKGDEIGFGDQDSIATPMPGNIVKILVKVDGTVEPGQPVFIIESMKMENEVKATHRGKVKKILVAEGDAVQHGDTVVELFPQEEGTEETE